MINALSPQHKAILFALIGFSCFSFSDTGAKFLTHSYSTYQTIAAIQLCSLVLLLLAAPKLGGLRTLIDTTARKDAKIHLLRTLLNAGLTLLLVYAFTQLPLTSIYTAIFAKPYIAALLAIPLLGQALGPSRIIAITIGFTGVLIAFRPWEKTLPAATSLTLIALPAMIALLFLSARLLKTQNLFPVAFWPVAGTTAITIPLALILDPSTLALTDLPLFFITGAFSISGILLVSRAFQIGDAAAVSPMVYIEMLWAILLGYIIFKDTPSPAMLLGSAIIIASGIYLLLTERRKA